MCTLYRSPAAFLSAWSQLWLHFVVLLLPTKNFCITPCLPILVELIDSHSPALLEIFFFLTLGCLKLGSGEFLGNVSNLLNKGKSVIPPLFNSQEVLSSASDKAKLSAENFSKNSDLDNSGIYHNMFSLLELIWNCIIFL